MILVHTMTSDWEKTITSKAYLADDREEAIKYGAEIVDENEVGFSIEKLLLEKEDARTELMMLWNGYTMQYDAWGFEVINHSFTIKYYCRYDKAVRGAESELEIFE